MRAITEGIHHHEPVTQPPIIPGRTPEPFTLSSVLPVSRPPRRPRWVAPVIGGLTLLVLVGIGMAFLAVVQPNSQPAAGVTTSPSATSTPIRDAYFACGQVGQVSDQDHTIVLATLGDALSRATIADVSCVLSNLRAPDYIFETMKKTRAIDGRQREQWATFEASWTYHPDHGLDVIIHQS